MATQPAKTEPTPEDLNLVVLTIEQPLATLLFTASPDKMRLFLECEYKQKNTPVPTSRMSLLGLLPKSVPSKLIHPEVLDDIANDLSHGRPCPRRRIAKGVEPVPGRDGKLVLLVKTLAKAPKNPEFVDPWFVRNFDNVEKGMPVARVYPPHPGIAGTDVLGNALPPIQGKAVDASFDDTLEQKPCIDGKSYISLCSKIDGYLLSDKSKLSVVHELIIKGDVDHHTGDIQFVGKTVVRGSVKKNFRLDSRDGIEIHGDVFDGILKSECGDIVIKGHTSGEASRPLTMGEGNSIQQLLRVAHDKPQISTGKNFKASVLEGVYVEALGDIEIGKASTSSYLRTRGTLRAPTAQIIGGEIYTVCGCEAAIFGSELETTTKIVLCSDRESSAEYGALVEKLKGHESAEEMLRLYLGPYAENPARIRLLNPEHRKKMESMRAKLEEIKKSKAHLLKQKEELLLDAQENSVCRVNFQKAVFPGVIVQTGEDTKRIDDLVVGPKTIEYLQAEKRFEITDQQPLQCHLEKRKVPATTPKGK